MVDESVCLGTAEEPPTSESEYDKTQSELYKDISYRARLGVRQQQRTGGETRAAGGARLVARASRESRTAAPHMTTE